MNKGAMRVWWKVSLRLGRETLQWLGLVSLLGLAASLASAQGPINSKVASLKAKCRADVDVQPFGSFMRKFQAIQADKAELSDFVVFLDEWFEGGTKLGPYGLYHMAQIALHLPQMDMRTPPDKRIVVMVQPQADPALNESHRQTVVQALLNLGVVDAETRVVIAHPQAEGLRYEDILRVYVNGQTYPQAINPYGSNLFNGSYRGGYYGGGNGFSPFSSYGGFGGARPIIYGY